MTTFTYPVTGTSIALNVEGKIVYVSTKDLSRISGLPIPEIQQGLHDDLEAFHKAEGFDVLIGPAESLNAAPLEFAADFLLTRGFSNTSNELTQINEAFWKCPLLLWASQDGEVKRLASKFYAGSPGVMPQDVFEQIGRLVHSLKAPLSAINFVDGVFLGPNGVTATPEIKVRWVGNR